MDRNDIIIDIDPHASDIFRMAIGDNAKEVICSRLPMPYLKQSVQIVEAAKKLDMPVILTNPAIDPIGRIHWFRWAIIPFHDIDKNSFGYQFIGKEIRRYKYQPFDHTSCEPGYFPKTSNRDYFT